MANKFRYGALGQWHQVRLLPLNAADSAAVPLAARGRKAVAAVSASGGRSNVDANAIAAAVTKSPVLQTRVDDPSKLPVLQGEVPVRRTAASARMAPPAPISTYDAMTLATQTVIAEGLLPDEFKAAANFGATVIDKGLDGSCCYASIASNAHMNSSTFCWSATWVRPRRTSCAGSPTFVPRRRPRRGLTPRSASARRGQSRGGIDYGGGNSAFFAGLIAIEGSPTFGDKGDSGSLVWTWDTNRNAVGLYFADSWAGTRTFSNPIDFALANLDVTIVP